MIYDELNKKMLEHERISHKESSWKKKYSNKPLCFSLHIEHTDSEKSLTSRSTFPSSLDNVCFMEWTCCMSRSQ